MSYTHLAEDERYEIYERKGRGESISAIANALQGAKSTISRELRRNTGDRGYKPGQAQKRSCSRLHVRRGGKLLAQEVIERCYELVRLGHSPQQAVGRCCKDGGGSFSHETLYQLIYTDKAAGGRLLRSLRCCKKRRNRIDSGR